MATEDELEQAIIGLLDSGGRIKDAKASAHLVEYLPKLDGKKQVQEMTVLVLNTPGTRPEVLTEFVKRGGVKFLKAWVKKCGKEMEHVEQLREILKLLLQLPMTVDVVQETEIGKAVYRLTSRRTDSAHPDPCTCLTIYLQPFHPCHMPGVVSHARWRSMGRCVGQARANARRATFACGSVRAWSSATGAHVRCCATPRALLCPVYRLYTLAVRSCKRGALTLSGAANAARRGFLEARDSRAPLFFCLFHCVAVTSNVTPCCFCLVLPCVFWCHPTTLSLVPSLSSRCTPCR